ncbi:MAG: right-handed parallel beta-helix repeat-containing protein [Tepidisphaeraceae bacterium]
MANHTRRIVTGFLTLIAALTATTALFAGRTVIVTPDGTPDAAGTAEAPVSIAAAIDGAKPGDTIELRPGTYKLTPTLLAQAKGTEAEPIVVRGDPTSRPVLDFSAQSFDGKNRGILLSGDYWTLSGIELTSAGDNGIHVSGHHNTIANCVVHDCQDTGILVFKPASHTLVTDCDSYRNIDRPTRGQNADGFGCKFEVGEGNIFRNCRAWENADDGWDLWKAPYPVRIENCVAMRNGINLWNVEKWEGNGNGFKLGGAFIPAQHTVVNCVAIDQWNHGFDLNNNTSGQTLENCTAIRCGMGFRLDLVPRDGTHHVLKRCLCLDSKNFVVEGSERMDTSLSQLATTRPSTQPATQR